MSVAGGDLQADGPDDSCIAIRGSTGDFPRSIGADEPFLRIRFGVETSLAGKKSVPAHRFPAVLKEMDTPDAMTDAELLRAWSTRRCHPSFRALVEKYLGLVQGVAQRCTGDAAQARDIAQNVFARLAAKSSRITAQPTLAPWLHHCAWCESASVLRRESTRTRRMKAYADHLRTAGAAAGSDSLHEALPHLDAALHALPKEDQRIVLMRFFEGRGLRDIADALGKTEAAVRKQGQRALEKLALRLRRQGVGVSTAALAAGLAGVLSQPSQAAAVTAISTSAAAAGSKLTLLDHVLTLMNTKTKTVLITAACMSLPLVWQWRENTALQQKLAGAARDERSLKAANAMLRDRSPARSQTRTSATLPDQTAIVHASVEEWEEALANPDPIERLLLFSMCLRSLSPEVAPEVAAVFQRLRNEPGGGQYESEQRQFLRAWGRLDGKAALAHCFGPEGKPNASAESLAALAGWAQGNAGAAKAWLEALEPGDTQTSLALGFIDGWALWDFDAASAYAASLPRSTVRDQFRSLLLQRALDSGGMPAAQRWFTGIPDDQHNQLYKQRAFDELIAAMMKRDPSAAAVWISGMGRQQFMSGDAVPEVASRLAASSPTEALRWLEGLGQGEGEAAQKSSEAYRRVLDQWSQKDLTAAGTWLQSQSGHPAYNEMAAAHAQQVAATDGAAAFAWTDSISDEATRTAARESVARAAIRARGSEANGDLAAAGYSDDAIASLTKQATAKEFAIYSDQILALNSQLDTRIWQAEVNTRRIASYDAALQAQALAAAELKRAEDAHRAAADFLAAGVSESAVEFHLDGADRATGSPPPGVTSNDSGYLRAHPGGAPANCAQCHQ
jgi:RNA polymerase sigma factor (sigma-70 family)